MMTAIITTVMTGTLEEDVAVAEDALLMDAVEDPVLIPDMMTTGTHILTMATLILMTGTHLQADQAREVREARAKEVKEGTQAKGNLTMTGTPPMTMATPLLTTGTPLLTMATLILMTGTHLQADQAREAREARAKTVKVQRVGAIGMNLAKVKESAIVYEKPHHA